jgi:hypothetical protein
MSHDHSHTPAVAPTDRGHTGTSHPSHSEVPHELYSEEKLHEMTDDEIFELALAQHILKPGHPANSHSGSPQDPSIHFVMGNKAQIVKQMRTAGDTTRTTLVKAILAKQKEHSN